MNMPIHEEEFVMGGSFVLNFANRTFAELFREEFQVDIDDPRWQVQDGNNAKRLRYYLRQADRRAPLGTLNALWEYREINGLTHHYPDLDDTAAESCSTR